jgi:hypothetical protein
MTLLLVLYLAVALLVILFLAYTDYLALGYNDLDLDLGILAAYLIAGLAWPIFLSVNVYYAIKYLLATRR